MWSLYLLSKQDSVPPCSFHYLYPGVSVHRDRFQLLSLGPLYFLSQIPVEQCGRQDIFIGMMKGKSLSSVVSLG